MDYQGLSKSDKMVSEGDELGGDGGGWKWNN
jgi:hypothetical protein